MAGESVVEQRKGYAASMGDEPAQAYAGHPGFALKGEWASCTISAAETHAAGGTERVSLSPYVADGLPRRTVLPNGELKRLKLERSYEVQYLRLAAARLASVQLRDGSIYSNLRTLVPVVVLAGVWTWVNRSELGNLHHFMNRSVGVRHLLLAVLIGTLWNAWLVLGQFSGETSKRRFRAEVAHLAAASAMCGLVPLLESFARRLYGQGLLLGGLTAAGLLAVSLALLGSFLAGALLWAQAAAAAGGADRGLGAKGGKDQGEAAAAVLAAGDFRLRG